MQLLHSIRRRHVLWTLFVVALLLMMSFGASCNSPKEQEKTAVWKDGDPIWVNHLPKRDAVSIEDAHQVLNHLRTKNLDTASLKWPESWKKDTKPAMVFLHAGDAQKTSKGVMGRGKGLVGAIQDAVALLGPWIRSNDDLAYLRLEWVMEVHGQESMSSKKRFAGKWFNEEAYGLAFDAKSGVVVLHDELTAFELVKSSRKVNMKRLKSLLSERHRSNNYGKKAPMPATSGKEGPSFKPWVFKSQVFVSFDEGTRELINGNIVIAQPGVKDMERANTLAGKFFTRHIMEDGKILYVWRPNQRKASRKFNMLRHAGSIYAMSQIYQESKDPELLKTIQSAIGFVLRHLAPFMGRDDALCVAVNGSVKLGGGGLALVALSTYTRATGDRTHLPVMRKIAAYLISEQREDGSFLSKRKYPSFKETSFVSGYYPGETILGLTMLYELDPDPRWIDTADKGLDYLVNNRDKGIAISNLTHDHWLVIGMERFAKIRHNPGYIEHAFNIVKSMLRRQRKMPNEVAASAESEDEGMLDAGMELAHKAYQKWSGGYRPDWVGSYYTPPRSTPSSCRGEGLAAAYRLADREKRTKLRDDILTALLRSVSFEMQMQYLPEATLLLPRPGEAIGGVRADMRFHEVRNDYVQHYSSSVIGARRILRDYKLLDEKGLPVKSVRPGVPWEKPLMIRNAVAAEPVQENADKPVEEANPVKGTGTPQDRPAPAPVAP